MSQNEYDTSRFDNLKGFDEEEWIRLLFLVGDLQEWLEDLEKRLFCIVPVAGKKNLFRKDFYLTAKSFAHIIERHYHKIARHPEAGKFTIPVPHILDLLKQTRAIPATPIPGRDGLERVMDTARIIGYDRAGKNTSLMTLISHPQGRLETAFPGAMERKNGNIGAAGPDEETE